MEREIPLNEVLYNAVKDKDGEASFLIGREDTNEGTGFLFIGTLKEAERTLKVWEKMPGQKQPAKYIIKQIGKTAICPVCGEKADEAIIEELGECLRCDHIRGEMMFG